MSDAARLRGVREQYATATGLAARIALHKRFSTASRPWAEWVFDQIGLRDGERLLEVGSGPASLWHGNAERVPAGANVTLLDQSEGMIDAARSALAGLRCEMSFVTGDARALPFADDSFDVVVANHMLYLVPDPGSAIVEFARVVRPSGRVVVSTNGGGHLRELNELAEAHSTGPGRIFDSGYDTSRFALENGAEQLERAFAEVESRAFDDGLVVTEAEPVVAYVASMDSWRSVVDLDALRAHLERLVERDGQIRITKESGVFVARRPIRA